MAAPATRSVPAPQPLGDYAPEAERIYNVQPKAPFVYRWRPEQWEIAEVEGAAVLLPQLSELILVGGVNGVLQVRRGDATMPGRTAAEVEAAAVDASKKLGWRHLAPDTLIEAPYLPAGVRPGPLRRSVQTQTGTRFHDAWETLADSMTGGRVIYDQVRRNAWLHAQVLAGTFGSPPPEVVERLREQLLAQIDRTAGAWPQETRDRRLPPVHRAIAHLTKLLDGEGAANA